ncbi:hypothetical protein BVI434_80030 [Burkholderia vietnamiensis]|nr:hypothetical protein BVI434_80030 [Burkholderia vietnamiensis]
MARIAQPDADRFAEAAHSTRHNCNSLSHPVCHRQEK